MGSKVSYTGRMEGPLVVLVLGGLGPEAAMALAHVWFYLTLFNEHKFELKRFNFWIGYPM